MPYFTDMRLVFQSPPGVCEAYDWLISDLKCSWLPWMTNESAKVDERFLTRALLLDGKELLRILSSNEIQFRWAVFSALGAGSKPAMIDLPFADGNPNFWRGSPAPQLNGANFEIVCWDSSRVLMIGVGEDVAAEFKAFFAETVDLDEYNRSSAQ